MTTPTPEPDLAALRELLKAADLPSPVLMTKNFDHNGDLISTLSDGTGVEARIYVEETADLIEAALNALPALLALVERQRADLEHYEQVVVGDLNEKLIKATRQVARLEAQLAQARKTIGDELMAEARRIGRLPSAWSTALAFQSAAFFVMGGEPLATPAPADATPEAEPFDFCPAWHHVKARTADLEYLKPTPCVVPRGQHDHADAAGDTSGHWFDRGESQYAWPLTDEPAAPAAAGADRFVGHTRDCAADASDGFAPCDCREAAAGADQGEAQGGEGRA